ncbi:MAG: hypothetical protein ACXWVS_01170 [Hyphomicrobium sp.]|jgi:hypothetical protein
MAREQSKKQPRPRKPGATEFFFWIDAFTPATIPMARLAEYMAQLATVLGEPTSVHFVRVKRGSTEIVHKIQAEAVPKVRERARAVRRGDAPRDALRAYETVNKMLMDDNGVGALKENTDAVIIPFPGRESAEEKYVAIKERGTIDGEIIRVGGPHKWVPVLIQSEGDTFSGCWADRVIAKQLAQRLFEPVRLFGTGKWNRSAEGKWNLQEFVIERFDPLSGEPLSDAIARLRAIDAFKDTTLDDIEYLRYGPPEKQNGGH